MPLRHWLQLALTTGIGPILAGRLLSAAGSAEAACAADVALLRTVEGIGPGRASKITAALRDAAREVDAELERASRIRVRIISQEDVDYPLLLGLIPDPPIVLYVRGSLQPRDLNSVGVVGSRKCSFYGREQAERFAALLAGTGITVLSGGARGVDSSAHRGAMSHLNGRTLAILGSGVDVPYPPENAELFMQIAERGAVISEFPIGAGPSRENFPRRNRIISGMSRGVLIIEADERSGALITARQAYDDQGRPVFAVPGRLDNPLSAGPHQLIRDGAILVTKLDDILEALHPLPERATRAIPPAQPADAAAEQPASKARSPALEETLSADQRAILAGLGADSAAVDVIIERTGLPPQVVLQSLTFLTLKGHIRRLDGQTFQRQ